MYYSDRCNLYSKKRVIRLKKMAAILATVGVLATASFPAMANASTVQNHANTLSTASSYSVSNILPNGSYTNTWGTSTLTSDDANMQFFWQVSPTDTTKSYTYNMGIDYYTSSSPSTYVGTIHMSAASGTGVLSGYVRYPLNLTVGLYYAKLNGSWTASDGTTGIIGNYQGQATTPFYYNP
jgi:hypothetical protein